MITIEALKQEDMPQLIELYKELISPHIEFNTSLERCLKHMEQWSRTTAVFSSSQRKWRNCRFGIRNLLSVFGESVLVVEDVIVRSDQRGKGVGRMLMEALDQFAKEKGCAYSFWYLQTLEPAHIVL